MSHYMTALAMKQKGLKPSAKIVLYWLADHHNSETGACFPSLKTLERECEMTKPSIVKHLAALEDEGLIRRKHRYRDNGSQTSTEYELCLTPVKNINTACEENLQAPVKKRAPHNLVINNQGNEPFGAEAPKPKRKAVSLPDGWVPNDKNLQDAYERGFTNEEITREADQFANYHTAKGSTFKNWDAAWRTWLGNARKFQSVSARPSNAQALSDAERRIIGYAATTRSKPSDDCI